MANNITDEEITRLAREYAEWITKDYGKNNAYIPSTQATTKIFLRWLSQRFCLVEKSRVKEEYKSAKSDCKMAYREKLHSMLAVAEMRKALLESLFGDTLKEEGGEHGED